MNSYARKGLYCALLVGGFSLLGIGAANAADTSGEDAVASGTQVIAPVSAPVDVDQNAISVVGGSVVGTSPSSGAPDATPQPAAGSGPEGSSTTSGADGVASGTQVPAEVTAPVNVTGNAITLVGDSSTGSSGGSSAAPSAGTGEGDATTSGSDGVASGTQVPLGVSAPVAATGNAVTVVGNSSTGGPADTATTSGTGSAPADSAGSTGYTTSGSDGVASGTQVPLGAAAPVGANGNAVALVGDSSSGRPAASDSRGGNSTDTGKGSMDPMTRGAHLGTRSAASAGAGAEGSGAETGTVLLAQTSGVASPTALAFTGADPMPLLGLALLFPLVGFGLLMGARRLGSRA